MKKLLMTVMTLSILLLCSCSNTTETNNELDSTDDTKEISATDNNVTTEYDQYVEVAIEMIKEELKKSGNPYNISKIKIVNTQVVVLKENPSYDDEKVINKYKEFFNGVDFIVEFEILSTSYGNEIFYQNYDIYDQVLFYKDRHNELLLISKIQQFQSIWYSYNFDSFVDKYIDLGSRFDQKISLN